MSAAMCAAVAALAKAREDLQKTLNGLGDDPSLEAIDACVADIKQLADLWEQVATDIIERAKALSADVEDGDVFGGTAAAIDFARLSHGALTELRKSATALAGFKKSATTADVIGKALAEAEKALKEQAAKLK